MIRPATRTLTALALLALATPHPVPADSTGGADGRSFQVRPLPAFDAKRANRWLNSDPLTVEQLRGNVVLLEVWTFGCVNCLRSIPWVRDVERRYESDGLRVVGIHAPEFEYERDRKRLRAFLAEHGISHPVLMDNDFEYWDKLGNRYWPAFYLVDRSGGIRGVYVGETHAGDARAREIEAEVEKLLAEPSTGSERADTQD